MNLYKLQSIQFVDTYVAKNSYERNIQAHYKKNKPTFYIEIHKNLYAFQTKAGLQRILRKNNIDGTKINWKELNLSNKKDLIHFQNELITSIY